MPASLGHPAQAQTAQSRVEMATIAPDGSVLLHISVPRGQTIEAAALTLGSQTLNLDPEPESLPVTYWFVLDGGTNMIDIRPALYEELSRMGPSTPGVEAGLVLFKPNVKVLDPANTLQAFNDLLALYEPALDQTGCVGEALTKLADRPRLDGTAWRVLLIAGAADPVSECAPFDVRDIPFVTDVLLTADDADDAYFDAAEYTGGYTWFGDAQTIGARLDEVKTIWDQPTFALYGQITTPPDAARGQVIITLSHGDTQTLPIRLTLPEEYYLSPTPTLTPEPSLTPTATPLLTSTPTEAALLAATQVIGTEEPDLLPTASGTTESAQQVSAESTPEESSGEPAGDQDDDPLGSVVYVLAALVMLSIGGLLIRRRNRHLPKSVPASQVSRLEHTVIKEDVRVTVSPQAAAPNSPAQHRLKGTAPLVLPDDAQTTSSPQDDLLITQLFDDAGSAKIPADASRIIGHLRLESDPNQVFEVRASGANLGRGSGCDIVISGDTYISEQHARISQHVDGSIWLTVLSRTNPVIINRFVIRSGKSHVIQPGDTLQFSAHTIFVFEL